MSIDAKTPGKISAKLPTLPDDLSSVCSTHMVEDNNFYSLQRLFFSFHKHTMTILHPPPHNTHSQ